MADRGLTAAMQAATASANQEPFHLLEMQFSGGTLYLCDAIRSVDWSGHTWEADGLLLEVGDIEAALSLRISDLSITLAGSTSMISLALGGTWRNRAAIVYRAMFAPDGSVVVDPAVIFSGEMDSYTLIEDPSTAAELKFKLASEFEDFDRVTGRSTNNESQQVHYPGEAGFSMAHVVVKDLKWGRT